MRCPVCLNYAHQCGCSGNTLHHELRKNDAQIRYWQEMDRLDAMAAEKLEAALKARDQQP